MLAIALFELRQRLRRLSTWVYFAVFFALSAFFMVTESGGLGFMPPGLTGGSGKVMANSPYSLMLMTTRLGLQGLYVVGGLMGQTVHQDFAHGTHTLFFTTPITRTQYLLGRFLGGFATLVLVFTCFALGLGAATFTPWVPAGQLGPSRLAFYLWPYAVSVLPNLFLVSALAFTLAALTRRMMPVYVGNVLLLVGYLMSSAFLRDLDTRWVAALVDPFGHRVLMQATEYWTVAEKNTRAVPLEGWLLANRLLWGAVGAALLGLTLARFPRTHALVSGRAEAPLPPGDTSAPLAPPVVSRDFRGLTFLRLLPRLAGLDLRETVKNVYFLVLVLAGVLLAFGSTQVLDGLYGTAVQPRTYMILEAMGGVFLLFQTVVIIFYSGELVWRERDARLHQVYDALPMPGWLPLLSKLLALMGVQVLLNAVLLGCGVLVQLFQGHTELEPGLYATQLFGFHLVDLWLLCVLALLVHVGVNHKYVGHIVMVLFLLASAFAPRLGFEDLLYHYGQSPEARYSDMNGFGPHVAPMVWFRVYWALVAVGLVLLAHLLWVRGTDTQVRWRLHLARARASLPVRGGLAVAVLGAGAVGTFLFHNTHRLNRFRTQEDQGVERAEYEKKYKPLAKVAQPRIVSVKVRMDLFPEEPRMRARGTFGLVNKTAEPVPVVYVNLPDDVKVYRMAVAGAEAPSEHDARLGVFTYTLPTPLAPGASAELQFELGLEPRGFRNEGAEWNLVENGTFLSSGVLPRLGYVASYEIQEAGQREKQGLPPRTHLAEADDLEARRDPYFATDADWLTFEATVSTAPDQVAVAPGTLQREWREEGRRVFHYTMDRPILNLYAFLSARYEVKRDTWNGVALEVLHHPGHTANVERMIQAMKDALDYNTRHFGPYPHQQLRILEFPRYQRFAQSLPTLLPYSESIGFIAQVDPEDPKDLDYPYYVTAHEVAHQWWGHRVVGGNVQGATLLSETLSQYSALMVMKHRYGGERMGRFLRYELDHYLGGRTVEREQEVPLVRVEQQTYLHYNKGSLVMYALQDALGEETVNRALASYLQKVAGQPPPFTSAPELLAELRAVTPESHGSLLRDLFERITLYENQALQATSRMVAGGYEVKVTARARKLEADGLGVETEQPLDDWIDVGVLDRDGNALFVEKRRVTGPDVEFTVRVKGKPARAGLDPLHKLIDRKPGDNTVRVEEQ